MSTLTTLRTRVEQNVAEPISTTGWFTPTSVRDWLNAGIEMVFLKIVAVNPDYFPIKTTTFGYTSGTQEYSLSSVSPFEVRRLAVTDRGTPYFLAEAPVNDRYLYSSNGEPHSFYWYMDYQQTDPRFMVGLIPTPDRTASNNVTVYYVPYPRTLVSESDTPDIPQEQQELAVIWATILALRSDQRPTGEWQSEFNFRLANVLSFAGRGRSGGPTYVNYRDDY